MVVSKRIAAERAKIEAEIPKHLMYTKGWPTALPTPQEAELIASVRRRVADLQQINAKFLTGPAVIERYAQLMAAAERRKAA